MQSNPRFRHWCAFLIGWLLAHASVWAGNVSGPVASPAAAPAKAVPPPPPAVAPAAPTAPEAISTAPSFAPSYTFMTTDALTVTVYDEGDLGATTRVDATGCINLNLVGKVKIVGLTISEAQTAIENAYRDQRFLRKPQVTINIQSVATREVSIEGQVKGPGRYPLPIETAMSVVDLVSKAGGFTESAKGSAVTITHFDRDGKPHVTTVDVQSIMLGTSRIKSNDPSLMLQPGDIVWVPESIF